MNTILTQSIFEAARFIKNGHVVAFPTETVYGLGANVFDSAAVAKIFVAKGRPSDNPLIAHVAHIAQIETLVSQITEPAQKFIAAFFPAPLTLVLPKHQNVPSNVTAGLDTIGVRMPNHPLALDFLQECAAPLVAPSANLSGRPSPTTWQAVYEDLNSRIDCILQGGQTQVGIESTVVDCTKGKPLVLRAGAITLEELKKIVPETELAAKNAEQIRRSPGLRYQHYAPRAKVVLLDFANTLSEIENSAFIGFDRPTQQLKKQKICRNSADYAHSLFAFFRECDAAQIQTIYCQKAEEKGLGVAINDRLRRAAS